MKKQAEKKKYHLSERAPFSVQKKLEGTLVLSVSASSRTVCECKRVHLFPDLGIEISGFQTYWIQSGELWILGFDFISICFRTCTKIEAEGAHRRAERCWIGSESTRRWTSTWRSLHLPPPETRVPPSPFPPPPPLPGSMLIPGIIALHPPSPLTRTSSRRVPCFPFLPFFFLSQYSAYIAVVKFSCEFFLDLIYFSDFFVILVEVTVK